uniref:Pecanex-like protein n=1 Tax=Heterorhabditis bacteriophora TaxID=37862 RepID=A0A1I7XBI2_HETBA
MGERQLLSCTMNDFGAKISGTFSMLSSTADLRKSLVHQSSVGGSTPVMTESIYDNMPKDKRKKSQEPQSPLAKPHLLARELSVGSLITDSGSAPLTPDQSLNSVETNKSFEEINRLIGNHVAMGLPSYTTRDRAGSCELLADYDNNR